MDNDPDAVYYMGLAWPGGAGRAEKAIARQV